MSKTAPIEGDEWRHIVVHFVEDVACAECHLYRRTPNMTTIGIQHLHPKHHPLDGQVMPICDECARQTLELMQRGDQHATQRRYYQQIVDERNRGVVVCTK